MNLRGRSRILEGMTSFGDIRSVLQRPPGIQTWLELCALLEPVDPARLDDRILPYCRDVLDRWPLRARREAPDRWVRALLEGQPPVLLSLANTLRCTGAPIRSEGAARLASCPHMRSMHRLMFANQSVGDEGVCALANSEHLAGLLHLSLRWEMIGTEGVVALASSPYMASLRYLDLWSNLARTEGARALASSPHLRRLRWLSLRNNRIGVAGARALADSPNLAQLELLGRAMLHAHQRSHLDLPVVWFTGPSTIEGRARQVNREAMCRCGRFEGAPTHGDAAYGRLAPRRAAEPAGSLARRGALFSDL